MLKEAVSLCRSCQLAWFVQPVRFNSNRAAITRIRRKFYPRMYRTMMVLPDGSTFDMQYKEPRRIIKLPLDLDTLSDEQKAIRLAKRKPKQTIVVEEDIEDHFDANQYSHLWKK